LLDERGIRVQAIAASNDRMAFGVLEALQQRGIQVPDSIALTGFDDVKESQSTGVPLTTVHQSFAEAGKQAFGALIKRMNGEHVPDINILPAQLVVRWSCGCLPENVQRAIVLPKEVPYTVQPALPRTTLQRSNTMMYSAGHGMYFWQACANQTRAMPS
jgi:ABC-type sugar transport system substrate-binding protein